MTTYPAKVLLFGEHIVMQGAGALAAPLPFYGGHWAFAGAGAVQMRLNAWADHLAELQPGVNLDIEAFRRELDSGLYFHSNIPTGYGLGSSGALCAAVYDRYAMDRIDPGDAAHYAGLRRIFAAMEGFFHGSSSGADPLICYLGRPVLLLPGGGIETVSLPPLEYGELRLFLLDSGISRQTGPLVQYFRERCADPAFEALMRAQLLDESDAAIQAWLDGQYAGFHAAFRRISRFQITHLAPMIPQELHRAWSAGSDGGNFCLKLCGAGGGGVFLGLTSDVAKARKLLEAWQLVELPL